MRFIGLFFCSFLSVFLSTGNGFLRAASVPADSARSNRRDSLVVSVEFLSKAIYSGRNYGVEQIGLNPSIAFHQRSGLAFKVYGYGMGNTMGLIGLTDFGASYEFKPFRQLTLTPGVDYLYNRFEVNKSLFLAVNLAATMDLKLLSVSNYLGFSFGGNMSAWYEEISLSRYFSVFYTDKASLAVSPSGVGIFGSKYSLTILYDSQEDTTTTTYSLRFLPLCISLQVPVTFTFHTLSLTVTPRYDIPLNVVRPAELSLPGNPFYIICKLSYALPIKWKGP